MLPVKGRSEPFFNVINETKQDCPEKSLDMNPIEDLRDIVKSSFRKRDFEVAKHREMLLNISGQKKSRLYIEGT